MNKTSLLLDLNLDCILNREIKNNDLEIMTIVKYKSNELKEKIDGFKFFKNKIYIYTINNSIKVFNHITLKEISSLNLPFEPINIIITEEETVLLHLDSKLYFYKINFKENKLDFICLLSDIFYECYLYDKKEIFILQSMNDEIEELSELSMGRTDLCGNIKFYNIKKPKILTSYIKPKKMEYNQKDYFFRSTQSNLYESFCAFSGLFGGFMKDKYIINVVLYQEEEYWESTYFTDYDDLYKADIKIYNTESLECIFKKTYYENFYFIKISDNLFEMSDGFFYFDEKKNDIVFFGNNDKNDNETKLRQRNPKYNGKIFYLKENMFGFYSRKNDQNMFYIIDLSDNGYITQIKINDGFKNISNVIFYKRNERKYIYFCSIDENKYEDEDIYENKMRFKIVHALIK